MRYVLDSSAFIRRLYEALPIEAEWYTTPEVYEELKTHRFLLFDKRLIVKEPSQESVREVLKISAETGDLWKLSSTDIRLIALAKDLEAILVTDDLAMQNVAAYIGIKFEGFRRITHIIIRRRRCGDKIVKSPDECPGDAKMIVWRKRKISRVFIDRYHRKNEKSVSQYPHLPPSHSSYHTLRCCFSLWAFYEDHPEAYIYRASCDVSEEL